MKLALLAAALLSGCGQAPQPLVQTVQEPTPYLAEHFVSATPWQPLREDAPLEQERAVSVPSPEATPDRSIWNAYGKAYREVKNVPVPVFTEGIPDPAAVSAAINQLGAKLDALKAARAAAQNNLTPTEKKKWQEYQRALQEEDSP